MAIDTVDHRLFSGCNSGGMAVSDYQAGKVVATVPIGQGVDGAGYDPASGDAFASNAGGRDRFSSDGGTGSSRSTLYMMVVVDSPMKGFSPVNSW